MKQRVQVTRTRVYIEIGCWRGLGSRRVFQPVNIRSYGTLYAGVPGHVQLGVRNLRTPPVHVSIPGIAHTTDASWVGELRDQQLSVLAKVAPVPGVGSVSNTPHTHTCTYNSLSHLQNTLTLVLTQHPHTHTRTTALTRALTVNPAAVSHLHNTLTLTQHPHMYSHATPSHSHTYNRTHTHTTLSHSHNTLALTQHPHTH